MKDYTQEAGKFYRTTKWLRTQKAYKSFKNGICERCGKPCGTIVHHKKHLNSERLKDPLFTLDWANLELLCVDCHNKEHFLKYTPTAEGLKFDENGNIVKEENKACR